MDLALFWKQIRFAKLANWLIAEPPNFIVCNLRRFNTILEQQCNVVGAKCTEKYFVL